MATYNDLQLEGYYLIREHKENDIILVQPIMETAKCFLLLHIDEIETTVWKKKEEEVFEIVEELTEEQVEQFENIFDEEDDNELSGWDFEQDDFEDEEEEDDDEEDETGEGKGDSGLRPVGGKK